MKRQVIINLGLRSARQAFKSMEFIRRNLERIAMHLPAKRQARDVYKQLLYDSSIVFDSLHDEIERACMGPGCMNVV